MAFSPLELAKKHPVLTGVGVFAIGVVIVLMLSGGNSDAAQPLYQTSGTDPSTVAANTALAQSQIQAGVQNNAVSAQLQMNLADIASRDKAVELSAKNENLGLTLQSNVALAQIAAQKDTQQMISTLTASVTNAQTEAQRLMNENNNSTQKQIAQISADIQGTQARYNAQMLESMNTRDITINGQNNAAQAALASIYANTSIQTQAIQSDASKFNAQKQADMFAQQIDLNKFNTAWTQDTIRQQASLNANVQNHMIDLQNNQVALAAQTAWRQTDSQNYMAGLYAGVQNKSLDVQNNQNALTAQTAWKQIDQQAAAAAATAANDRQRIEREAELGHATLYQRALANQFSIVAMQGPVPF